MNKLIYLFLFVTSLSFAQKTPGFHPEAGYAYEDFGKSTPYDNLIWQTGTFPVKVDSMKQNRDCINWQSSYTYLLARQAATKSGNVTCSQPYSSYKPFIMHFGTDNKGKKKTLDLSHGNAKLAYSIKNNESTRLMFYFRIIDSTGKIINAVGEHHNKPSMAYSDMLHYYIDAGQTITGEIDFNTNAYDVQYMDSLSSCGPAGFSAIDKSFNYKIVSGLGIAFVNNRTNQFDAYKSFALTNASFTLSEITLGGPATITGLTDKEEYSGFTLFPNPAREKVSFSKPLNNITLTDIAGKVVIQSLDASELSLNNLEEGIYILKSSSLSKPYKLIVK